MHTSIEKSSSGWLFLGIIIIAIGSRFLPHWHNFTAIGAAGIFGVAFFKNRWWAYLAPLLALFASDLLLNNFVYNHFFSGFTFFPPHAYWTYAGFALLVLATTLLFKQLKLKSFVAASIVGTVLFFLVTNFGSFLQSPMYPKTAGGLFRAYLAGIPFALNSLLANLFYGSVLIGAYQAISSSKSFDTSNA